MIKVVLTLLSVAVVIGLAATGVHQYRVAAKNKKEMVSFQKAEMPKVKNLGRVLVIYYSLSGHTEDIARRIQRLTGADLYKIETATPIIQNPSMYLRVKRELKERNYPGFQGSLPEVRDYDLILFGAPVWWYTMATPAYSFLQKMDFAGKKIAPFSTQGSNFGEFFNDFAAQAKNAQILKGEAFNNLPAKYDAAVDAKTAAWLNSL